MAENKKKNANASMKGKKTEINNEEKETIKVSLDNDNTCLLYTSKSLAY